MAGLGFTPTDFAVFKIQGFSARMQEIYARVRPKLMRLGDELAPELARKLHLEFFPHVARHARRTLNPPPETWAAFGQSPKGYKRYGYLALCISGAGLHARMVVKAEADRRPEIARGLKSQCRPAREVAAWDGSRALREMGFQNAARTDGGRRRAFHGARRGARQKDRRDGPRVRMERARRVAAGSRRVARRLPRARARVPNRQGRRIA